MRYEEEESEMLRGKEERQHKTGDDEEEVLIPDGRGIGKIAEAPMCSRFAETRIAIYRTLTL